MISKELLTEVFKRKVRTFVLCDNILYFQYEDIYYGGISGIDDEDINIYELAHKCKEWALRQGYCLRSCIHDDGSYERYYSICDILKPLYDSSCLFDTLLKTTEANTELEAIFKACQWILDKRISK